MDAEVIAIGDELTSGQRLDTNSQWLSERLGDIGIRVLYHTTVADDLDANLRVFRQAVERADVVVASGGLGPTADDLTREVLAQLTGGELVLHEDIVQHIRGLFARFGREMPERNTVQAMFPAGSRVIPNPAGTAPGIAIDVPRAGREPCHLFALPGVPAEMFRMWDQSVGPELVRLAGAPQAIRHRRIKCFGLSESELEGRLPDLIRRGRTPSVGITVSAATITLRITAQGASEAECQALIEPVAATIYECLGNVVFGEEEDELEHVVARLLAERGKTLATVEWGTGGLVAHRLHEATAKSGYFLGGIVVPNDVALARLLSVAPQVVVEHTPVSAEVVEAMARGGRERLGADLTLAVSQFPQLSRADKTPQRLFLALASADEVVVRSAPHFGSPDFLTTRAAKQALNLLRLALLDQK
ncbi:MAG: CinA family nicotinamide mononucleotide deamidase-related protein [Planctomycetia bacterium]|nr:CinA family nicotinamide mononucleotide deamidase-related protein [Planctomycetia bacterium]